MQKPRSHRRGLSWTSLAVSLVALAGIASKTQADSIQMTTDAGPVLSESEVRDCLCMEKQMAAGHDALDSHGDQLSQKQQELANLDQQVQQQRAALSPTDTVGQQVLKDLMSQQQELRDQVQRNLQSTYNAEVNRLNILVSKYNGLCVNRPRYEMDVKSAEQNLQCPKP